MVSTFLTGDIIFLLSVFAVLFVACLYIGKSRFISLTIAFYPATLFYSSFPFMSKLIVLSGDKPILFNKLAIFVLFLIPIYLVINKYVSHYGEYGAAEGMLRTGGLVAGLVILFVIFSYTTINLDLIHDFGSQIDAIFSGESRIFWWKLAPLVLLALL